VVWDDENALDEEMMNLWVVVITNTSDGSVVTCYACRPPATGGTRREIDEVCTIAKGAYTIYSFANISVTNVCTLLGVTAPETIPDIGTTPVEVDVTGTVSEADSKVAAINGNNFDPTAADNGYGEMGIPMSNRQTTADTDTEKDLIVVRMLAKIELRLYNDAGSSISVTKVTLSDVTKNAADNSNSDNLKLLPVSVGNYLDDMAAHHQDIRPNLSSNVVTGDFTKTLATPLTVGTDKEYSANDQSKYVPLTFYVNESPQLATGKEFYLTLEVQIGTATSEMRYALVSNNATNEWNYIARNDYRIIPIVIDDYKLELIPYDFPPIGVYPCSVREIENELYEMTFHDYGHFHLLPKVTKLSTSASVPFGTSGGGTYWTLNDGANAAAQWAASWKTAVTKGGDWVETGNPDFNADSDPNVVTDPDYFYRNQTATADGDEAGGVPVWYQNGASANPRWDPDGNNSYPPFIFGYIREPDDAWWSAPSDRQVYHEFRVKLYVGNEYRRDLLYRFYMTLSAEQMLGVRRHVPIPRKRH
jgi:hypothetical protein